ncbi:MAG: hypothetical protein ACYC4B_11065 [Pirellulaceae bacterium]
MISLLIGIFLVILFIVTIVLSASTWRAWHIVAACLTFLAALGLVIVGSLSLKTHNTWRKTHAQRTEELTRAEREGVVLEIGDPTLVEPESPPVNDMQHRLNRILLDQGRVWRRCTPAAPTPNGVVVSTVPPAETGEPGDPNTAMPNGITANMVLYAFLENENRMPIAYLGEFLVADAQPTAVTLQPTMPLDGQQQALVAVQPASWTLYEMMPVDAHRTFSDEDTVARTLDDTPQPIFGTMNEENLRTIFATVTGQPADSPIVGELIAAYLKDGSPASEQDINESPQNIWLKLEFEKAHTVRVDSNNPDPGMGGNYFDAEGYAEASQLRRGEEASFQVNDVGVFPYVAEVDKNLVDELISSGTSRNLGPHYVRTLRDYEEAFHDIQNRFVRRTEDIARAQRDVAALNATIAATSAQSQYRHEEHTKLQQDLQGYEREKQQLTDLVATLEAQKTSLRDELSSIFQANVVLAQQLTEYNAKLTEEINRRTAEIAVIQ